MSALELVDDSYVYCGYIISKLDCLELIFEDLNYRYGTHYDQFIEKWQQECYTYVANVIIKSSDLYVGNYEDLGQALFVYLNDNVFYGELDQDDFRDLSSDIDDAIDNCQIKLNYLWLQQDYVKDYGPITNFDCCELQDTLDIYLAQKVFKEGFRLLSIKIAESINLSISSLQRKIRTRLEKKKLAKKILDQSLKRFDTTDIHQIISSYL